MTGLDLLRRCREGYREIAELDEAIASRHKLLDGSNSLDAHSAPTERMRKELENLERRAARRRREHDAERAAALWIVECLPTREKRVMAGWYLERKSIGQIAIGLHMSASTVKRNRARGMKLCAEIPSERLAGYLPEWYEKQTRQSSSKNEPT